MSEGEVLKALTEVLENKPDMIYNIFSSTAIPVDIEKYVFNISSLDFVEMVVDLENILNIEISDDLYMPMLTIGEFVKRIMQNAE